MEVAIIRDKSGASRGFGFVTFKEMTSMDRALEKGDEQMINGTLVEVKKSTHGETASCSSKKVFVGGVGPRVSKDDLRKYFSTFGPVDDAQVMYDYVSGRSRGFGFVTFENEESARDCMATKVHMMGGQLVDVKAAMPRPIDRQSNTRRRYNQYEFSPPRGGNLYPYGYLNDFVQYPMGTPYHPGMTYLGTPAYGGGIYDGHMGYPAYAFQQFVVSGPADDTSPRLAQRNGASDRSNPIE
jgi:RNA recognition motif-containing protein